LIPHWRRIFWGIVVWPRLVTLTTFSISVTGLLIYSYHKKIPINKKVGSFQSIPASSTKLSFTSSYNHKKPYELPQANLSKGFDTLPTSEKQLGSIRDIFLPLDAKNRYDLYFTDSRIAIVCMGKARRLESDSFAPVTLVPSAFGVPPPAGSCVEKTPSTQAVEEELKNWSLTDILKLSKKSCYYTYEEIEDLRLILGSKPKFEILSEDSESKFTPNPEQLKQLINLLPTMEPLRNKLSVAGNWNVLQEIFREHSQS
jgi:hypothetical protein